VPTSSETLAELPATVDLHARPAADFVRAAMRFEAEVLVAANGREVDAKSLIAVLALGAKGGTTLRLRASGADADRALDTLATCVGSLEEF
jgi:phosphotransferase system HPr (HPr) family protein